MANIDSTDQSSGGIGGIFEALKNMPTSSPKSDNGSIFKMSKGHDHGMEAFKSWLGPKKYKEFINNLLQSISNNIKSDQAAAKLAADKLKAVETGQNPDDVTS